MSPEWIQVRLRRPTAHALREYARRQFRLTTLTDAGVPAPSDEEPLSLDAAVKVLLWKAQQEEERQDRHARKRKRTPDQLDPPDDFG